MFLRYKNKDGDFSWSSPFKVAAPFFIPRMGPAVSVLSVPHILVQLINCAYIHSWRNIIKFLVGHSCGLMEGTWMLYNGFTYIIMLRPNLSCPGSIRPHAKRISRCQSLVLLSRRHKCPLFIGHVNKLALLNGTMNRLSPGIEVYEKCPCYM